MAEFKKLPFGKVLKDVTRNYSKIPKSEYLDEGLYPIIDQGKDFICGYTNDPESVTEKDKPIIIFGDHTRVFKFIDFPIAIGADGVKVLEVDSSLADEEFVYEYLCTINLHNAGYSRHFKYLKEVKIPVPDSIDVQKRIAAVLQKTDLLISKRKESIELANEFLKHTFLTMFGDPILNEKKWKTEVFDKVTNKVTDGEHQNPKLTNSGFNLIMAKCKVSPHC
jgi:type I restriction enzyme S subunit